MIDTIITYVYNAISSVFYWFSTITYALDGWKYIFSAIAIMLVVRFIIYPFLKEGVASGSDGAKKKKDG